MTENQLESPQAACRHADAMAAAGSPADRGTGRTQRMIDELCDAVVAGQPRSIVVAHNHQFALSLCSRVIDGLHKRGLRDGVGYEYRVWGQLDVEGGWVRFVALEDYRKTTEGLGPCGEFWDHEAVRRASPDLLADSDARIARGER